jgi:aldose 1-epimerase
MGAPSGEQVTLRFGDQQAIVTEVGASLRSYEVSGTAVVAGYAEDEIAGGGRGQVLAPWPNRLADGQFEFAGRKATAALDEPQHDNAIHGLVRWLRWRIERGSESEVTLSCIPAPQPAYPFALALDVTYSLAESGLQVTSMASSLEDETGVPFGLGFHPYLSAWGRPVDEAVLAVPASERLLLDGRGLPTGSEQVAGTEYDFRSPRPIGGIHLDDCFTGLSGTEVVLSSAGGEQRTTLWVDEGFGYLMCYTGDTLADPAARRRAIAVEPMTCAPNALRNGLGLIELGPGETWSASWGLRSGAAGPA